MAKPTKSKSTFAPGPGQAESPTPPVAPAPGGPPAAPNPPAGDKPPVTQPPTKEKPTAFIAKIKAAFAELVSAKTKAGLPVAQAEEVAANQLKYDHAGSPAEIRTLVNETIKEAQAEAKPGRVLNEAGLPRPEAPAADE